MENYYKMLSIIKRKNNPLLGKFNETDGETIILENLNRINLFIGPNNSGKSVFLRELFTQKDFRYKASSNNNDFKKLFKNIIGKLKGERNTPTFIENLINQFKLRDYEIIMNICQQLNCLKIIELYLKISKKNLLKDLGLLKKKQYIRNALNFFSRN